MAKGLTFKAAQAGAPLTAAQKAEFDAAITRLEATDGVVGITGDCGFLMNYQHEARRQATLPCFVSAVMQCHILSCAYAVDEEFLVLTANGATLRPSFDKMLSLAHVTDPARQARFHVLGCETVDGFDAVAKGEKVDVARVTPGIVALAKAAVAANPRIRAVLLECTELPPYADSLRCELTCARACACACACACGMCSHAFSTAWLNRPDVFMAHLYLSLVRPPVTSHYHPRARRATMRHP